MKTVILDMYGVILKETGDDFVPYIQRTFPNLRAEEIYEPWNKADVGELSSLEVFGRLGFTGDLAQIQKEYLDTIKINEGFYTFAKRIKEHNRLALISNDSREWSSYLREKYDLDVYFDVITISGELKIKKPDERIFLHTLDRLGCTPSDCTYVDDRRYNLEAAQKLGMDVILFNSRNVQYSGKIVSNFIELEDIVASI